MNQAEIFEKIRTNLSAQITDISMPSPRRIFVSVAPEKLIETLKILKDDFGFYHLSTISGLDKITGFEVLYHLANSFVSLTVRVQIDRAKPEIISICEVIPGAILYEREIQDMFGIKVINIPDSRPLVLPDDWPEGEYPLRKDWNYQPPAETIPGEEQ
ncbi:MAG: NADH-quinone oxidoreductase subunit C [Candidatus Omnitrophica bacterium]|nr:NADH-quinone oxidoreductase subunit C [Candidatus Omnitrophota bacterium]